MKKLAKILLLICLLFAVVITFTIGWRPFIGPRARATSNRHFERTPERLARGRYLVTGLVGCETCPASSIPDRLGAPWVFQSFGVWQVSQPTSPVTR